MDWRARCAELAADRDYWRGKAETWETRYVESSKQVANLSSKIVENPEPDADDSRLPGALEVALERSSDGLPKDIARRMRREVALTYAKTEGTDDVRVIAALKRLREGDSNRVAAFLGEID